ncbi:uncharacterized protein I303_108019 [Kwoniella dejecticola CBS 10117]|uniref:Ricin B lectin domain-containing protein n=1 Tax=Kwoniella dejecticola CBS 10117 TaxID=1296121 RepID=A0A1A5ZWB5_9TREE|nr:uncharacterized protein I303_08010 [Kwoniella dejecticola CBS 10117]OBR82096.1 hypothetical protein I303_08010 [Kwoniella dejecticola CBS 10117]
MSSSIAYATTFFTLLSLLPSVLSAPSDGTTYQIESNHFSNKCMGVQGDWNGAKVVLKDCDDDDTTWKWTGSHLENTATNKCIDIPDGGWWNGNKPQIWDCFSYNTNQQYSVVNSNIKWGNWFCLDITDGNSNSGTTIQLWQCFDGNTNQQWTFTEVEEVEDPSDDDDCESATVTATATATSTIGGGLWVGSPTSTASSSSSSSSAAVNETASTTADWWATSAVTASATASVTASKNSTQTASATSSASTSVTTGSVSSGYLQTSGSKIVDSDGNEVVLRGTNIGGWLVWEDWMCGITDSMNPDRFPLNTLESRFGADQANTLWEAWINNWLTEDDFDNISNIGFNVIRLPFGFRNLYDSNGNWRSDAFTHLDWAVAQAKKRGIYVILDFHIWAGQQASYSAISENTSDGQSQRDAAGEIWKKVATHYLGEPIIAAFDIINEPTGSWGNNLQQDLYNAVRSVDANRIIIHESISTDPRQYGWTNVVYSFHEYLMMGSDYSSNVQQYAQSVQAYIDQWTGYGIPSMLGEFMADGETLSYILNQANKYNLSWLSWAHSTVNMGRWGLWNHQGFYVDVSSDSYDSILNQWSNMPSKQQSTIIYDQFKAGATGSTSVSQRKRDEITPVLTRSERVEGTKRLTARHGGRSRRSVAGQHGIQGISF